MEPAVTVPDPLVLDDGLRAVITRRLADHPVTSAESNGLKRAAVAIVIVDSEVGGDGNDPFDVDAEYVQDLLGVRGIDGRMTDVAGGAAFLLCRRGHRLHRHAAQWALPGGRMDDGETAEQTARRELREELGVDLGADAVLGRLDDYVSRSGYVITPVVMWAGHGVALVPEPMEVAAVYRIGLHQLLRADSPRFVTIPESPRPVVQIPLGGDLIHAPTGAVLLQFRLVALDGRVGERVDHLEQPVFAWR